MAQGRQKAKRDTHTGWRKGRSGLFLSHAHSPPLPHALRGLCMAAFHSWGLEHPVYKSFVTYVLTYFLTIWYSVVKDGIRPVLGFARRRATVLCWLYRIRRLWRSSQGKLKASLRYQRTKFVVVISLLEEMVFVKSELPWPCAYKKGKYHFHFLFTGKINCLPCGRLDDLTLPIPYSKWKWREFHIITLSTSFLTLNWVPIPNRNSAREGLVIPIWYNRQGGFKQFLMKYCELRTRELAILNRWLFLKDQKWWRWSIQGSMAR